MSAKSIVGGPPAAASTISAPRSGASSASVKGWPRSPRKTRCIPSARKWTIVTSSSGLRSGVSKTWIGLEPQAAKLPPLGRNLKRPDDLERRHDLAEVTVIAVVLVTDNDHVGRLVDRLVTARVGRPVRVEDDPHASGLDQERRVAVPGDSHWKFSNGSRW